MDSTSKQQFRDFLKHHLSHLKKDLDAYEQTTHGCMCGGDLRSVCDALMAAEANPSSYTISTLSQMLDKYLGNSLAFKVERAII